MKVLLLLLLLGAALAQPVDVNAALDEIEAEIRALGTGGAGAAADAVDANAPADDAQAQVRGSFFAFFRVFLRAQPRRARPLPTRRPPRTSQSARI